MAIHSAEIDPEGNLENLPEVSTFPKESSLETEADSEFSDDPSITLPPVQSLPECPPEQLLEALCTALFKNSPSHRELAGILAGFIPGISDQHTLVLSYDQRKISEHDVRIVLEAKNLALLKRVLKSLRPLGNLVISRWNPAGLDEIRPGLRQVNLEEMEKLAESPFVKRFNDCMGTTVIDARVPVQGGPDKPESAGLSSPSR